MPPEKEMADSRTKRNRVIWGEAIYREVQKGLTFHNVRSFKPPSPGIRVVMKRTVEAYIAGELEPFSSREIGNRSMQRRVYKYTYQENHPTKPGIRATRSAEIPMEMKYLSSILYHSRDAECEAEDWETGAVVKPWIAVSADDGSAVRLLALVGAENGDEPEADDSGLGKTVLDEEDAGVGGGTPLTDDDDEDTDESIHGRGGEGKLKRKKRSKKRGY